MLLTVKNDKVRSVLSGTGESASNRLSWRRSEHGCSTWGESKQGEQSDQLGRSFFTFFFSSSSFFQPTFVPYECCNVRLGI